MREWNTSDEKRSPDVLSNFGLSFSESHPPALGTLSIRESRQFTKEHLACRERI
jgi:hypothetical protein